MHLPQHIKLFIFFCFFILTSSLSGQGDTLEYVRSPYRAESTSNFRLNQFKRGVSSDSLRRSLDLLEAKPRTSWSRQDSLKFAQISLGTGNVSLSDYYFDHLNVDLKLEEIYWYDHLMIYYLRGEYETGITLIKSDSPMILQFSRTYFFKKIFEAKINQRQDSKWYKTNTIFNWEIDSSLSDLDNNEAQFQNAVVEPLRNLEFVLKRVISFVYEDDPILALACKEMGYIIQAHLNMTHAYIAFNLARHYNKKDKALLEDIKLVKAKMREKKFKIPNFRKYFPRIEKWRFEYQVLKEKVIFAKSDTNVYVKPQTMNPKKEQLLKFPYQYVVLGGLLLFIILIAIVLKMKKK